MLTPSVSGSPVTALRRADLLSDLRIVDDQLLVFDNNEGSKVKNIGHLVVIRNVKVLRNLTNIIIPEYGLQLLNYEIIFCKHAWPVKIKNLDTGKVIFGVQAAGVLWINLSQVYDITFHEGDTLAGARCRAISKKGK